MRPHHRLVISNLFNMNHSKKPNMAQATNERENTPQDSTIEDTDGQGSSKLQQKLKEVDTFVQNYSGSSAPRPDPIWNKTDMVSMDDLIAFDQDLGEELEAENNNLNEQEEQVIEPVVIPERTKSQPVLQENRPRSGQQPKLA